MNKLENANLMNSILIVEDDANVRQSLENLIGKSGYNVVSEYSGPRAVKRMLDDSRKDISIVLMDIRMPGDYDGIEAARRITAARPDASLIFVSGFTEVAERIEDVKLDVAGWIPKPIVGRTADNLLASIDKVVEAKFRDSIQKERSKEGALDDKEDQISKDSNLIKPELILPVTQGIRQQLIFRHVK